MKFGDNHKVKLGKKRSKTNGVKLSKMAPGLWGSLGATRSFSLILLWCSVSFEGESTMRE